MQAPPGVLHGAPHELLQVLRGGPLHADQGVLRQSCRGTGPGRRADGFHLGRVGNVDVMAELGKLRS